MSIKIGTNDINKLYTGTAEAGSVIIGNDPVVEPDYLCFEAVQATDISFVITGELTVVPTLKYRKNNGNWTSYTFGTNVSLAIGDKCYFKGNNTSFTEWANNYILFTSTDQVKALGNIMSLLDETCKSKVIPCDYCFYGLFSGINWAGCNKLLVAPSLPATTLANNCYQYMFYGCTSLTTAPELPATTLAPGCYSGMFRHCTSLTAAPELPATTLANGCYSGMFRGCTSLTTAPELPATTLTGSCYQQMFYGCTSLTIAPKLPATSLASSCYNSMFQGCTSLTAVPELPATTLAENCYRNMFVTCTSLYVSDTQTTEAIHEWKIPTEGTFTNETTYKQASMFEGCLGTRSSNNMSGAYGESHTYYTQNEPI